MRFSSEYRPEIITDALRFQTLFYHQQPLPSSKVIQATKIHWSAQRVPVLLRIQSYCVDQIDANTNRYLCSYDYKDIDQLIPLTSEGETTVRGFLIQDKKKPKKSRRYRYDDDDDDDEDDSDAYPRIVRTKPPPKEQRNKYFSSDEIDSDYRRQASDVCVMN